MPSARLEDRRRIRHAETREQIVAEAMDVMRADGVGGLSLGELARRIGVRPPSLYTYFPSKGALYDELFRRGWQECLDLTQDRLDRLGPLTQDTRVGERLLVLSETLISWSLTHPELGQLMFFRPVPHWEPSETAYAPSLRLRAVLVEEVVGYRAHGLLRDGADLDELLQNVTTAGAGIIARQLADEPGVPYARGSASRHFPALLRHLCQPFLSSDRSRPVGL